MAESDTIKILNKNTNTGLGDKKSLDIFKTIVPEKKLHDKYKLLSTQLKEEQKVLKEWTEGFIDRDNKIIKEFQTTFHSSFWEFYLHKVFTELGLELNYEHQSPDFLIKGPKPFAVEAVVAGIKQKGRPESERNFNDTTKAEQLVHLRDDFDKIITEAIIRNSSAIHSKLKKYTNTYSKQKWIRDDTPYVIAVSSFDQIDYGYEFIYAMLQLLYGQELDIETFFRYPISHTTKPETGSKISLNLFEKEEFKAVSAIIFSCTVTLGKLTSLAISKGLPVYNNVVYLVRHDMDYPHFKIQEVSRDVPEELQDGLCIFYNPNAQNPLPQDIFRNTSILQYDGSLFYSEQRPLYARYNRMKQLQDQLKCTLLSSLYDATHLKEE